jgi:hypothetical protein
MPPNGHLLFNKAGDLPWTSRCTWHTASSHCSAVSGSPGPSPSRAGAASGPRMSAAAICVALNAASPNSNLHTPPFTTWEPGCTRWLAWQSWTNCVQHSITGLICFEHARLHDTRVGAWCYHAYRAAGAVPLPESMRTAARLSVTHHRMSSSSVAGGRAC